MHSSTHTERCKKYVARADLVLQGSLSRALGLARSRSDKHSPTSSSESSSVISRISVSPLQQSGGESPVYATPYNYRYSYTGGSGRDLGCECRSTTTPTKDFLDNIVMDGSSKRHRRVRSIGDIDVMAVAPV